MSTTFEPKYVPSEVISRWPVMALALWKRSFKHQAGILLTAALMMKFIPAWAAVAGFLIAPSLFLVSFAAVRIADEQATFSWGALIDTALPGALRLGYISLQFAACFGLVVAVLFSLSSPFLPDPSLAKQPESFEETLKMQAASADPALAQSPNVIVEFLHFCATWAEGVMAMVFLGIFVVAIYQGIFGVILYGQEGVNTRISRTYGWQAWQINSESIEKALRDAPPKFFKYLAMAIVAVICGFQTVYFSPIGLVLATYIPCLAYVAYRSIFFAQHENVAASNRVAATPPMILVPARLSLQCHHRHS
jgi:hypothetical protein